MDTKHSNKESYDLPTTVSLEEGPRAAGTRGSDFKKTNAKTFLFDYMSRKYGKFVTVG